ncbi:UNVERIFIED_CONTAM: hypothetical protein K2H54_049646 [Gekko kuhli]
MAPQPSQGTQLTGTGETTNGDGAGAVRGWLRRAVALQGPSNKAEEACKGQNQTQQEDVADGQARPQRRLEWSGWLQPVVDEWERGIPKPWFRDIEKILLDQFVCGLQDERMQRKLFTKEELTFQAAVKEALAFKKAEAAT